MCFSGSNGFFIVEPLSGRSSTFFNVLLNANTKTQLGNEMRMWLSWRNKSLCDKDQKIERQLRLKIYTIKLLKCYCCITKLMVCLQFEATRRVTCVLRLSPATLLWRSTTAATRRNDRSNAQSATVASLQRFVYTYSIQKLPHNIYFQTQNICYIFFVCPYKSHTTKSAHFWFSSCIQEWCWVLNVCSNHCFISVSKSPSNFSVLHRSYSFIL